MHNKTIIIATTNRFDKLDEALVRRLPYQHHMQPFSEDDIEALARKFFNYAGYETEPWLHNWCLTMFDDKTPASTIIKVCTDWIVQKLMAEDPPTEGEPDYETGYMVRPDL